MNDLICDCNIINEEVVNSVKLKMPNDILLNKISDFFKIVGDYTRLRILYALLNSEMCVGDIANLLNMTKSSISHQLKELKDRGLIKNRKVGKEVYYSLDDDHVKEVLEVARKHIVHRRAYEKISI